VDLSQVQMHCRLSLGLGPIHKPLHVKVLKSLLSLVGLPEPHGAAVKLYESREEKWP